MPRASRYFLPGHVWHITHRCHKKEFLLKFAIDRQAWVRWLFEARKRYGLSVLNYMVTSNHVHLLVKDQGHGEIAKSMQLVAGRVAQEFNQRKGRTGAFWEDRYHATAVATDHHFARCLTYIDMNMVRAGAVKDPEQWQECGLAELSESRQRYAILDTFSLGALLEMPGREKLLEARRGWIRAVIEEEKGAREEAWSESLAVGDPVFVTGIKVALGQRGRGREVQENSQGCILREAETEYGILPGKT